MADFEDEFTNRPELHQMRVRLEFWKRLGVGLVAAYMVISMTIFTLISIDGQFARNRIEDCTTPSGECYKDNQENTGKIVAKIVDQTIENAVPLHKRTRLIVVLAAYCADQPGIQTAAEIEQCVTIALEQKEKE